MEITYQPIKALGMDLLTAEYKGVRMELAEFPDGVSIYSMESKIKGKGLVQEMIAKLKEKYGQVWGSVPLNATAKHIFDKMGVIYQE